MNLRSLCTTLRKPVSFFGNKRKDTNHPLPPHCPEEVHSNPCPPKRSVTPTPLSPNRCLEYSLLGTCFQSNSVPWLVLFPLLKIPFILLSIYLNPSQLHFFLPQGAFLSPCHLRVAVRGHGRETKRASPVCERPMLVRRWPRGLTQQS